MAETIEMITWPKHKNILYQVTSSAFTFEVKGSGNAFIGLGSNLHKKCEFIIKLENNSFTSIVVCNDTSNSRHRHSTPDLFSMNEYRRFWITWYGGWLVFGREGETKPTVSIADPLTKIIKYVTFGIDRTSLHWRFDISPLYKRPKMKQISDGALRWVSPEDQIPDDAVIGGYENEILYIIRAHHRGSLTPGKFVPSFGVGFISWGGTSHEKGEFEVLCGYDCYWVPSNVTKIPVDAMEAGYSEDRLERLYIGRAKYLGHFIPGKVQISHKACYISFGDREIAVTDYDVLACPHTNPYSVNKVFVAPFGGRLVSPEIHQGYESPNAMDEGEDDDYYEVEEDNFED